MKFIFNNRIIQHLFFWFIFFFFFSFIYSEAEPVKISLMAAGIQFPNLILVTYLQLYFLIPRFLLKKKFLLYLLLSGVLVKIYNNAALITLSFFGIPLRTGHAAVIHWDWQWQLTTFQIYPCFGVLAVSGLAASIKLLKKWFLENDRNKKIAIEKNILELEMLKEQVHPDFFFNTLNNLYTLTLNHSIKAPLVVTHLSDLLRYMLYDCNEKEVHLKEEIAMLKKYVELEKIRYGSLIDVSFSFTGNTNELMIAPLLLIPFVENSFQQGVNESSDQCWINIHLHSKDNELYFNISHSFDKEHPVSFNYYSGLNKIKKRLGAIYPEKFTLNIYEEEDLYAVKLKVYLNSCKVKVILQATDFIKLKPAKIL